MRCHVNACKVTLVSMTLKAVVARDKQTERPKLILAIVRGSKFMVIRHRWDWLLCQQLMGFCLVFVLHSASFRSQFNNILHCCRQFRVNMAR